MNGNVNTRRRIFSLFLNLDFAAEFNTEMKINVNSLSSRRLHYRLPRGFVTFLESKTQDEETQVRLNYYRYTVEARSIT